jgi:predicted Rossmann fold nucleotide-binding protein DprA/Smf involved in DNA uptake
MMNQIEIDLKAIAKDLKRLTQKTEKMIERLKKLDKAQAAKKPKAKSVKRPIAKKPTRMSSRDTVLAIIKRSRKGVDTPALKNKTGLKDSNIRTILYRLRKQGKIKTEGRGLYVKA